MENKIAWEKYPEGNKREEVFQFAENYRKFISDCKTERECVSFFVEKAEKAGFVNLEKVIAEHTALKAGDRVYANNMGKGMALFVIGKESMEKGMNILGAHIDSPRLDLKQDPLYEDTDFCHVGYPLLWRDQEIPVGNFTAGITWRDRKKRRNCCRGKYWG